MKKISFLLGGFALCFAVACSSGSTEQKDSVEAAETTNEQRADSLNRGDRMEDDQEFLVAAASGGLLEVQLGKMAVQNASNARVKEFGKMMSMDHGKANEELKALAAQKILRFHQRLAKTTKSTSISYKEKRALSSIRTT